MEMEGLRFALKYLDVSDARAVRRVSRSWRYADLTTERPCGVMRSYRGHTVVGPRSVEYDLDDVEPKLRVVLPKPVPLSLWPIRIVELEISSEYLSWQLAAYLPQMAQCKHLETLIVHIDMESKEDLPPRPVNVTLFEHCASLRHLRLEGARITGSVVLPLLTQLSLQHCRLDEIAWVWSCLTLRILRLNRVLLNQEHDTQGALRNARGK